MIYMFVLLVSSFFFFNDPATTEIYTLSLHDALPISAAFIEATGELYSSDLPGVFERRKYDDLEDRSEEHTSELQSRVDLVCRLLLEKKKKKQKYKNQNTTRLIIKKRNRNTERNRITH